MTRCGLAHFSVQSKLFQPLTVRLSQFGLGYITDYGADVDFVVGLGDFLDETYFN